MKKTCLTVLPLLVIWIVSNAQPQFCKKLKLKTATQKLWAGGIAGRSGSNYSFVMNGSPLAKVVLDSIWIKDEGVFSLQPQISYDGFEINIQSRYDTCSATHSIDCKRMRMRSMYPTEAELAELQKKPADNPFTKKKCEAVLVYSVCGKKRTLIIAELKRLEKVVYP